MHQDPGKRSSDPTKDWPRLACECPGVSGRGVDWCWTAAGLGPLSVAVDAWDLLKITIVFITSTTVSVQFSHSVVSDSLQPHELQHARPSCTSPAPGVHPNSCASSQWCHPTILSSVIPFSSCPQSLPASGSFPTSQLFTWGGQSIGAYMPTPTPISPL